MAYEDIAIGDTLDLGAYRFTADEIKRFANAWDPQPFHIDEAAAAASVYGGLIASGWHTAAIMMKLLVAKQVQLAQSGAGAPFGPSPGFDDMRWPKPVRPDDILTYGLSVVDKRLSESRPGWGILDARIEAKNQTGDLVFSMLSHVFVRTQR